MKSVTATTSLEERFWGGEVKCVSQSEARAAILFFPIGPKNTNLVEDVKILVPVKFRWIHFSGFWGEVENISANQRPRRPSCFSDQPEKHELGRGCWDLASCQVSLNSIRCFRGEVENVSANQTQRLGRASCFSISPKNTNLVEDVEILLPVKFCWIPFSGFRGEVENVLANQWPWQPSCFLIGPKNTNLVEDLEILLSVKFHWIPSSGFRGEVENPKN